MSTVAIVSTDTPITPAAFDAHEAAYEKSLAETGTPNEGEAYPPDALSVMTEANPQPPTTVELQKAYDDAVALWAPQHKEVALRGLIFYDSLHLPAETTAHVLSYLKGEAATLKQQVEAEQKAAEAAEKAKAKAN